MVLEQFVILEYVYFYDFVLNNCTFEDKALLHFHWKDFFFFFLLPGQGFWHYDWLYSCGGTYNFF